MVSFARFMRSLSQSLGGKTHASVKTGEMMRLGFCVVHWSHLASPIIVARCYNYSLAQKKEFVNNDFVCYMHNDALLLP